MKKTLFFKSLALLAAVLLFSQLSFAEGDGGSSDPYTDDQSVAVTLDGSLNDSGDAVLTWDEYQGGDLKWYKVVHSTTNPDAYYPVDGYVGVYSDSSNTTYTHTDVKEGTNYYRVCVITTANLRGCSNTITLEGAAGTDNPPTPTDDPYTDDDSIAITLEGSLNDAGKADLSWTQYDGGDLKWYKVVRSQDTQTPYYPVDGYIAVYVNADNTTHLDTSVPAGTSYYRVCVITNDDRRGCSNTVTIEKEGTTPDPDKPTSDGYTDDSSVAVTLSHEVDQNGGVYLSWNEYTGGDLKWYKVVHSTTNSEPYYPNDGYVKVYTDSADTSYTHTDVKEGRNYYSVCVITTDNLRGCSNVVKVDKEGTTVATAVPAFPDTEDHWADGYIKDLADDGVVEGRDGNYEPDEPVLRAEAVKMILVALDVSEAECDTSLFPDMDMSDWFCPIITKAYILEIIEGEDGQLYPGRNISRAEAVKVLIVALGIDPAEITENPFPDVDSDEWYARYAYKAKIKGFISGTDEGMFEPARDITRAEMAKIVSLAS
ncbi:S-layer homology domain-containing protein [Patescibacteria group bacterium]